MIDVELTKTRTAACFYALLFAMSRSCWLVFVLAAALAAQVKVTQGTDRIAVEVDGKPFTDFIVSADGN
jgi:hypothetical protein